MNRNTCIKCWCGIMESSNLECLSSIHRPPSSILNFKSSILHPSTSNLFYPTSIFHLQLFFDLDHKVLKIAWFLTKGPQVPLAAFFRSAYIPMIHGDNCRSILIHSEEYGFKTLLPLCGPIWWWRSGVRQNQPGIVSQLVHTTFVSHKLYHII